MPIYKWKHQLRFTKDNLRSNTDPLEPFPLIQVVVNMGLEVEYFTLSYECIR